MCRPAPSRPGRQAVVAFQLLATALGWDASLGFCIEFARRRTGLRLRVPPSPAPARHLHQTSDSA